MLLLVDGFERLLAGVPLLSRMLRAAPGLKLLVASRERLKLHGEWVYPLEGLTCPADEPPSDLAACDAVRLFLQTAGRVHLGFRVEPEEQVHLVRICRLVAGLPLALEMAAAWVRLLSLAEIAQEIARSLNLLVTPLRDLPAHHRSIRAVFERSWQLLSPEERGVFARLAVFRGSFRPAEAQQVAGASLSTLSALVDKSLLRRLPSGRYRLHELLRQYAAERLGQEAGAEAQARERHCRAYAALAAPYREARDAGSPMPVLALIGQEMDNLRAAWEWAVARGDAPALEAMYAGLADYFHLHTAFQEGEAFFRGALENFGSYPGAAHLEGALHLRPRRELASETRSLLPWRLRAGRASFAVYLGRFAPAQADLERCLAVFSRRDALDDMAHCQFFLGEIARFTGDPGAAARLYEQSLTNYRRAGNRSAVGFCLNGLGVTALALGELEQAGAYLRESLAAFRAIEHDMGATIASINLADLLMRTGDYGAAGETLDESLARCRKLGHRWGMATCLLRRGDLAERAGRRQEAKAAYLESLGILQEIGQRQAAARCLIRLGGVCRELGHDAEAERHLREALVLAAELQDEAQRVEAARNLDLLLAARDAKGGAKSARS